MIKPTPPERAYFIVKRQGRLYYQPNQTFIFPTLKTTTRLLFLLLSIGHLVACQQSGDSKTMPQKTTDLPAKPRIEYKIVFVKDESKYNHDSERYLLYFERIVNQHTAQGWQPIGGITLGGLGFMPAQAMVRTVAE